MFSLKSSFLLLITILSGLILPDRIFAQDELETLLDNEMGEQTDYTIATFKSTRIINGHSIERMQQANLDVRIAHRFGKINQGWREFFGLDNSSSYLSLEYGIFDWIMIGIGRATYKKMYNGFYKLSLIRQCSGKKNIPVSISAYSSIMINSTVYTEPEREEDFSSRLSYAYQVLIARKFNPRFSAQLSPTLVHRNLVKTNEDDNDLFAIGLGARYKITNRISVNAEYFYVHGIGDIEYINYYNPISVGFDIETGSHVFQLHLTNSYAMVENGFIGETTYNWWNGDICFGFNISRVFTLK